MPTEITGYFITDFSWKRLTPSLCNFLEVKFASYISSTSASGPEWNRLSCGYVCTSQSFACNFMQTFLSQISSHNHKLCFYFLCQLKASSTSLFFLSLLQYDYIKVITQVQALTLDALHLCSKIFWFTCTLYWSEPGCLIPCQLQHFWSFSETYVLTTLQQSKTWAGEQTFKTFLVTGEN